MSLFDALVGLAVRQVTLAGGDVLFRAGDAVRTLHLVSSGTVRLMRQLPHGPALCLQRAESGSILAEASLFAAAYHCDAVAASPALLLALPCGRVRAALSRDPALARLWTGHLATEVQRARTQVEIISLKTVAERLDVWVALGNRLPPRGQWHRVAGEIGVTSEALYRELARRRDGAEAVTGRPVPSR